jgi:hypothetical protein
VANSTSTMHKIHAKPFALEDFSHDHLSERGLRVLKGLIGELEDIRLQFVAHKRKEDWYDLIQLLPASYEQLRTCTLNYETLVNIYYARKDHKLEEWHKFCRWIQELPYGRELIVGEEL